MNFEKIAAQIPSLQINMPRFLYVYGWLIYKIPEFFDISMIKLAGQQHSSCTWLPNVVTERLTTREAVYVKLVTSLTTELAIHHLTGLFTHSFHFIRLTWANDSHTGPCSPARASTRLPGNIVTMKGFD